MSVPVDIIGPAGFDLSDRTLRRAGLDYLAYVDLNRHVSWESYLGWHREMQQSSRIVLLSSRGERSYTDFAFSKEDTLLLGRESAGVPDSVRAIANASVRIPMRTGLRSLNIAVAAAMVLGEALRQTGRFPK